MSLKEDILSVYDDVEEEVEDFVEEQLSHVKEYGIPEEEMTQVVREKLEEEFGLERGEVVAEETTIRDMKSSNSDWTTVKGEVVELWEANNENISQTGLIQDKTGRTKFTIWEDSREDMDIDRVNEGNQYLFENFRVEEYEGQKQINSWQGANVEVLDEDMDIEEEESVEGVVVSVYDNSGLIKRDEEGQQVEYDEEGQVELKTLAVIDDGKNTYTLTINSELTEELTGLSVGEAEEMAEEALDRGVVTDKIREELLLSNLVVEGYQYKGYFVAQECEMGVGEKPDIDNLLARARQVM